MKKKIDEVLKILIHPSRREIIKILALEGPQSYSELMKKLGYTDSGTFGFHLRTLGDLIEKNENGKYQLSDFGKRIYESIIMLEEPLSNKVEETQNEATTKETIEPERKEVITISDRLSLDLDKDMLMALKNKGQKLYITDVITLTIHKVPSELLDEVLEGISDVISVNVPKELKTIVELKTQDVMTIKTYEDEPPRSTGFIDGMFSQIGSFVAGITTSILSQVFEAINKGSDYTKKPITKIDMNVKQDYSLELNGKASSIELTLGDFEKIEGEAKANPEDVNFTSENGKINLDIKSGKLTLNVPAKINEILIDTISSRNTIKGYSQTLRSLNLNTIAGASKIDLKNLGKISMKINATSSSVNQDIEFTEYEGEADIEIVSQSSIVNMKIRIPEEAAVDIDITPMSGGISFVEYEGKRITKYRDPNYEKARQKIKIKGKTQAGAVRIKIEKQ